MKTLHVIAFALLMIGGLNWLLVSFGWNFVTAIFGVGMVANTIYFLVGVAAIYELATHYRNCRLCSTIGTVPKQ